MSVVDQNVEDLRTLLADRAAVGLKKYGVTTMRNDLDLRAWLQHALEETLDKAVYLRAAIRTIDEAPRPVGAAQDLIDVLDAYPEQLVPINRESATVRALRDALRATGAAGK
jgi:hypothetical protein